MKTPLRALLVAGFVGSGVWAGEPAGLVIEAEGFQARTPDDNTFAVPTKSPSASGGAALTRFFGSGRVTYPWTADRAGTYQLWVRYSSNQDHRMPYAVDPAPGALPPTSAASVKSTGGLDAWTWARLGEVNVSAGRHVLVVGSAALRLDCFWISAGGGRPPEQATSASALEAMRENLDHPLEPITPDWLAEADAYVLPAWYDAIRVSAHTRLSWPMRARLPETFAHAGERLHSIGFQEISRHIKSGSEGAWWPSAVGAVLEEARTRNFAREIIDEAHAHDCRIMVYCRHMEDEFMAKQHPEWRARDDRGAKVSRRGDMMCLNTPYADFMQTRLQELARMGADGFYFDEVHMAKPLCYCDACRRGFEQATGRRYPAANVPADPVFQRAIEYRNVVIERVFRRWRAAIHEVNPQCVMLVGSNTYPAMNDRHTTHRLWRVADAMKSEFSLATRLGNNRIFATDRSLAPPEPDARIALAFTLDRDACDGRPPHVWAHGIADATAMRFAAAGMITHGQVANLDHDEASIPDARRFGPAVELGHRVSPAFAGTRPLRWAAIHFSEYARDHYVPDERAMWRHVLYPVYGAYTTLLRAHLPVGIVTDSQLEQGRLDGYEVLFVADPLHLTARMRAAIDRFKARGGLVIEQNAAWEWHRPGTGMAESSGALLRALAGVRRAAPVQASGGPEKMHQVAFLRRDGKRVTIALVNDFSWVKTGELATGTKKGAKNAPRKTSSVEGENEPTLARGRNQPPPPCRGVRVVIRVPGASDVITDVVTGRSLKAERVPDGLVVSVPEFDCLSVLLVDVPGTPGR